MQGRPALHSGEASLEREVENATVAFSYTQCECPSGGGPFPVPLQQDPLE